MQREPKNGPNVVQPTSASDNHNSHVGALEKEIAELRSSLSWKISAPLRWIGKPFIVCRKQALKIVYATSLFRWIGKPLAKVISSGAVPLPRLFLPNNELFDAAFYAKRYPDAARSSRNLWAHYLGYGADESRQPNPFFDSTYYLSKYS